VAVAVVHFDQPDAQEPGKGFPRNPAREWRLFLLVYGFSPPYWGTARPGRDTAEGVRPAVNKGHDALGKIIHEKSGPLPAGFPLFMEAYSTHKEMG
jgi:hypothetical protein